jgi:hypothetical protein
MERNFRPLLSMKGKPHEPPRAPPHREAWQMINRMLLIAILAAVLTYGAVDIALRLEQNRSAAIRRRKTRELIGSLNGTMNKTPPYGGEQHMPISGM